MESLRAGYERLRRRTEAVSDKVMKQALNSGTQVRHAVFTARQHTIRGRVVVEEHQISEGGFAFVWQVRDVRTNEEMALKKIVCQDRDSFAMARREVDILERLPAHPNIVKYYGHTTFQPDNNAQEVLLLFELCTGGHLLNLLEKHKGVLQEDMIIKVMTEICNGVALLHTQEPPIQHRDLKVENILLGPDGSYKLCDFGSWSDKVSDPSNMDNKETAILQEQIERYTTMMYRPPEMVDFFQQFPITEKVDIWMLGCLLFTLMFYRHPFQDEGTLAISNARYTMPSQPVYSERLQDLTHWLLSRDPSQRPTVMQLLDMLHNFGSGGSLPLPRVVSEKKELQGRLYSERPAPTPTTPSAPATPSVLSVSAVGSAGSEEAPAKKHGKSSKHHSRHSKHREHKEDKEEGWPAAAPSFWAKADMDASAAQWPPVAVPEPSRAWATFVEDTPPPQHAFAAAPISGFLEESRPQLSRSFSPASPSAAAAPLASPALSGAGPLASPASSAAAPLASPVPSAAGPVSPRVLSPKSTRPSHTGSLAGGLPFASPTLSRQTSQPSPIRAAVAGTPDHVAWALDAAARPPLAHSGQSNTSKRSTSVTSGRSHRSESQVRNQARSSVQSEPLGRGSSSKPSSPSRSRPLRASSQAQDPAGDFWSLAGASDNSKQPWDPFTQNVQWPGLASRSGAAPPLSRRATASAAELERRASPVRHRVASSPAPRGGSQSSTQHPAKAEQQIDGHPQGPMDGGASLQGAWMPWASDARFQQPRPPAAQPERLWPPGAPVEAAASRRRTASAPHARREGHAAAACPSPMSEFSSGPPAGSRPSELPLAPKRREASSAFTSEGGPASLF